jgi:PPOX class probable F420-dependent enzyme
MTDIKEIPDSHLRLLQDPVYPTLATIMPDGQPQAHPVWCDYDGRYVRVNTAKGRQKDENLVRNPHATLLLLDPEDPYFWMEIRGEVAERVEGGPAEGHIDSLSNKYRGKAFTRQDEDEVRVMYKIAPQRILVAGNGD